MNNLLPSFVPGFGGEELLFEKTGHSEETITRDEARKSKLYTPPLE